MIEGIFLGALSYLSLAVSWWHLPSWVRSWLVRRPLVADAIAGISTWFFITAVSKSLVAVVASFISALLVNISIIIYGAFHD